MKRKVMAVLLSAAMMLSVSSVNALMAEELSSEQSYSDELLSSDPLTVDEGYGSSEELLTEGDFSAEEVFASEAGAGEEYEPEAGMLLEETEEEEEAGEAILLEDAPEEDMQLLEAEEPDSEEPLSAEEEETAEVGALSAPAEIKAVVYNSSAIRVSWKRVSGAKRYRIQYCPSNESYWRNYTTINASKNMIVIGNLTYGMGYWFRVCAMDSNGRNGSYTSGVYRVMGLATPGNLKVISRDYKSLRFSWAKVPHATNYYVYMATSQNGYYSYLGSTSYGSFYKTDLILDKQYYFKVEAHDSNKNYTSERSHQVHTCPRETPTAFKSVRKSGANINVKWYPCKDAKSYDVYRSINGGSYKKIGDKVRVNWFTDKNVKSYSTYRYYIRIHYSVAGNLFPGHMSKVASIYTGQVVRPASKYHAVLAGEVNYTGANSLPHCEYDMLGMQKMLKSLKGNWGVWYKKNATRTQIFDMITQASRGMTSTDVLLFFYSGHGYTSSGSMSGALALANGGSIRMSELASALKKFPGKVIVIMDSCGSGAALNKSGEAIEDYDPDLFNQSVIDAFADVNTFSKEYGEEEDILGSEAKLGEMLSSKFYVLAGAQKYKYSYTTSNRYTGSMLTNYLVTGTGSNFRTGAFSGSIPMDTNRDRAITLQEAYSYTYSKCYNATRSASTPQRVQVYPVNSGLKMFFR